MVNEDIEIGGVTWEAVMSLTAKKSQWRNWIAQCACHGTDCGLRYGKNAKRYYQEPINHHCHIQSVQDVFVYLDLFGHVCGADSTTPPGSLTGITGVCLRPAKKLEEETWPAKTDMATYSGGSSLVQSLSGVCIIDVHRIAWRDLVETAASMTSRRR